MKRIRRHRIQPTSNPSIVEPIEDRLDRLKVETANRIAHLKSRQPLLAEAIKRIDVEVDQLNTLLKKIESGEEPSGK